MSSTTKNTVCPRCLGPIPNALHVGEYMGAMSRVDNSTEICSQCGTDEAMEGFFNGTLTPLEDWPVSHG